ncbi:hypothetical protein GE09DRAFT_1234013 [Coniochaeta sp. 2T2.1]|nr:hypothetical protein GE09DRAFT_1234013 [Coniochaeta sp. 2T2.1]
MEPDGASARPGRPSLVGGFADFDLGNFHGNDNDGSILDYGGYQFPVWPPAIQPTDMDDDMDTDQGSAASVHPISRHDVGWDSLTNGQGRINDQLLSSPEGVLATLEIEAGGGGFTRRSHPNDIGDASPDNAVDAAEVSIPQDRPDAIGDAPPDQTPDAAPDDTGNTLSIGTGRDSTNRAVNVAENDGNTFPREFLERNSFNIVTGHNAYLLHIFFFKGHIIRAYRPVGTGEITLRVGDLRPITIPGNTNRIGILPGETIKSKKLITCEVCDESIFTFTPMGPYSTMFGTASGIATGGLTRNAHYTVDMECKHIEWRRRNHEHGPDDMEIIEIARAGDLIDQALRPRRRSGAMTMPVMSTTPPQKFSVEMIVGPQAY